MKDNNDKKSVSGGKLFHAWHAVQRNSYE